MESKQSSDEQHLDWTIVEPERIESPALRDLVNRIQQAKSNAQGQMTEATSWSNWRDTKWKQRR